MSFSNTSLSATVLVDEEMVTETEISSEGLFGKKKKGKASKKDAFSCKKKKGPNIYSAKNSGGKSRRVKYTHLMSTRKKMKNNTNTVFSDTKKRYNIFDKKKKDNKAAKSVDRGRKSKKQPK